MITQKRKRLPKVYHIFGAQVKSMRKFLQLTQAEVAESVGLPREAIVAIEKGTYGNINLEQLNKFAKALNLTPQRLANAVWSEL